MAKRRKRGDGSLHLRKDGRWEGRVVVGYDEKGHPKTKNVLAKTKSECSAKLKALKASLLEQKPEKPKGDMTFGTWLDHWYQRECKPQIRPKTQADYENRIYQHIIPELGSIPLAKLTAADLQQFYNRLKEGGRLLRVEQYGPGLSDRMVKSCHVTCRVALDQAVAQGLILKNPALSCKAPVTRPKEMQVLTGEEIQRLLIQAKEDGCFELLLLELSTGLRRGEILALQWDDLDFRTGVLRVERQVQRIRGKLVVSQPKTRASSRSILLPAPVLKILEQYRQSVTSRWMFPSPRERGLPAGPHRGAEEAVRRAEAGGLPRRPLPRSAAHLCHQRPGAWDGCKNSVHSHRPCVQCHHVERVRPCHRRNAAEGGGQNRPGHHRDRAAARGRHRNRPAEPPFSRSRANTVSRAPGVSPKSMTTCGRVATPPRSTASACPRTCMRKQRPSAR